MLTIIALEEARSLLKNNWTKGAFARNREGNPVAINSGEAVSFDLAGAIAYVSIDHITRQEATKYLSEGIDESLSSWNDQSTLEEVLACLSGAIGCARASKQIYADEDYVV